MAFSPDQVERLLRPIRPSRVFKTQGQSNLAAWDVRAHLTRMFGFGGWQKQIISIDLISEVPIESTKDGKTRVGWYVTYSCHMRLTVKDPAGQVVWVNEDGATGSAQNQPDLGSAHDLAYKNAISYALKRCAIDLGDQFGLGLYAKGSLDAVVGMTLVDGKGAEPEVQVEGDDHDPDATSASARSHRPIDIDDGNGRADVMCAVCMEPWPCPTVEGES